MVCPQQPTSYNRPAWYLDVSATFVHQLSQTIASDLPLRLFEGVVGLRVNLQDAFVGASILSGADFHYLFEGSAAEAADIALDLGG